MNLLRVLTIFALMTAAFSSASARTIYMSTTGDDANDGLSWATAKKSLAGIGGLIQTNDEVWVAEGTYSGSINAPNHILSIYGGFKGNELTKEGRSPRENQTVFTSSGITNTSPFYFRRATLDGLEFRNISSSGYYYSPAITAIEPGSTVRACVFRNVNPGAIWVANNSVIENCIFVECSGKRVVTISRHPYSNEPTIIRNCTFWNNQAEEGLFRTDHHLALYDNIFQGSLFSTEPLPQGSWGYGNYFWQMALPAQWSWFLYLEHLEDPQLYEDETGTISIRPFSPCLNGGSNQVLGSLTDINGNPRMSGGRVDCGAVELSAETSHAWLEVEGISRQYLPTMNKYTVTAPVEDADGRIFKKWEGDTEFVDDPQRASASVVLFEDTLISPTYRDPGVIYVKQDGDDRQDGLSWATARASIRSAAISCSQRDKIYVAGGEYAGSVTCESDAWIEGGFDPETGLQNQLTVITSGSLGMGGGIGGKQGLVLRNISVRNTGVSAPKLDIQDVSFETTPGSAAVAFISIEINSEASIRRCQFVDSISAVSVSASNAIIEDCDFVNQNTSAISAQENANIVISRCRFFRNGYAVTSIDSAVEFSDCLVVSTVYDSIWASNSEIRAKRMKIFGAKEKAANISGDSLFQLLRSEIAANYEGIYVGDGVETVVAGCTIVDNYTTALSLDDAFITNSIIAFNGTGLSSNGIVSGGSNIVHGNSTNYLYTDALPGDTDADPAFALDRKYGDYRLSESSPAVDSASSAVIPADITGRTSPEGGGWDIGASEGVAMASTPRVVRVKAGNANVIRDGASWETAYSSIGEASADIAVNGGAEIWVSVGSYQTLATYPFAHVVGAFQGNEIISSTRRPTDALTRFSGNLDTPTAASLASCSSVSSAYIEGGRVGLEIKRALNAEVNNSIIAGNDVALIADSSRVSLLSNTIVGTTSQTTTASSPLMKVSNSDFTFVNNAVAECQSQFSFSSNHDLLVTHNRLTSDCSLNSLGGSDNSQGLSFWRQNGVFDKRYLHPAVTQEQYVPGINAGNIDFYNPQWRDVSGATRLAGSGIDIGAREYGAEGHAPLVTDDGDKTNISGKLHALWSMPSSYLSPPAKFEIAFQRINTFDQSQFVSWRSSTGMDEDTYNHGAVITGYKYLVQIRGERQDKTPIHIGASDGILVLGNPISVDYYKTKGSLQYHVFENWIANSSTRAGDLTALQNETGASGLFVDRADTDLQAGDRIGGMIWRDQTGVRVEVGLREAGTPPKPFRTGVFSLVKVKPAGYPYQSGLDVTALLMTLTGRVTSVVSRDPLVVTLDDGLGWWVAFRDRTQRGIMVRLTDKGPVDVGDFVSATGVVNYRPTQVEVGTNVFGRVLQYSGNYNFPELLTIQPGRWELVGP